MNYLLPSACILLALLPLARLAGADKNRTRLRALAVNGRLLAAARIVEAKAWGNRSTGLLNHAALPGGVGLWLTKTRAVHTRGMLFALDLVFISRRGKVLEIAAGVPPDMRRQAGPKGTRAVLELTAGAAADFSLKIGDTVALTDLAIG